VARELAYDDDGNLLIDVRGPRFAAALTMTVLAVALTIQGTLGTALVGWQVFAFAIPTLFGLRYSVYGNLFRALKHRFDLGPPPEVEPEAPPRFAQLCGLVVAGAGLVALFAGAEVVGWVLVAVVLALSTLLALTGICIGCELYLLGKRLRTPSTLG
jgi:hypothetical protein